MPQNKPMKIQWITVNGRQVPLVLPQVWNEGKQEWVVTSEYNPLPTADTNVKAELESIKQTQQQILQRLNQPINTQLTGSKVEKIFVFNAVAMNTTSLNSQTFDVSKFQQIHVLAQNTLNEVITIRMRIDDNWIRSKDDTVGSWLLATIEPDVNYTYSLNTYKPFLFQNVINTVRFTIVTQNPPTSGSVTIKILGVY